MKAFSIAVGVIGVASAVVCGFQSRRPTTLVITGDFLGFLNPCGCTSPQLGGIKRQATVIRDLQKRANVVWLSNGALLAKYDPQDQLKVNVLAQAFGALNATAVNLSPSDAHLGLGGLTSIQNLSDHKLVSGSITSNAALPLACTMESQGMLIKGIAAHPERLAQAIGTEPIPTDTAVTRLVADATSRQLAPVLLFDGNEQEAKAIAAKFGELKLIVYRSTSNPESDPIQVGNVLLVSPGELEKHIVEVDFDGAHFTNYHSVALGEGFKDDEQISRFYKTYLSKVDREGLLEKVDRHPSQAFAGNEACGKCHKSSMATWQHSKHHLALADLEKGGNQRDPECVSCHVIGLHSTGGFQSRLKTPELANVGCESCHGPGALHSKSPKKWLMAKIGTSNCVNCHTSDQSPNFNALTAWKAIKHR